MAKVLFQARYYPHSGEIVAETYNSVEIEGQEIRTPLHLSPIYPGDWGVMPKDFPVRVAPDLSQEDPSVQAMAKALWTDDARVEWTKNRITQWQSVQDEIAIQTVAAEAQP